MTLVPCLDLWGAATMVESDPHAATHRNAVYVPMRTDMLVDDDRLWGLYRLDGSLIMDAAYLRLPAKYLVGQCLVQPPPVVDDVLHGDIVYGGPVIQHYGHFLTAALPRLWQIMRQGLPSGCKILFHSQHSVEDWFAQDFMRTIFHRLGISPGNVLVLDRPTRVARLHVPRVAFEEQTFGHRVFRELCAFIGRPFGDAQSQRPVYLSKSKIGHGTYRITNEDAIDAVMAESGIDVVFPETLSFAEQVALVNSRQTILGTIGSSFHTSLFGQGPKRIIGLAYGPTVNANYALIDGLVSNDATYVYPDSGLVQKNTQKALFDYSLDDPFGIAHEMIGLI